MGFIKCWEILDELGYCWLPKKDLALWRVSYQTLYSILCRLFQMLSYIVQVLSEPW
jgi:hypothetical protein